MQSDVFFLSVGVRFTSYHGNFMLRSTDLMALPAVDCDKAYAAQLSLEEAVLTTQTVYFQVALLYPYYHCILSMTFCNCVNILCEPFLKFELLHDDGI